MCFSPEADLTIGAVAAVVGVDALRHVSRPQQIVLAALPLLLSAHQIDEAFVWWGLRGEVSEPVLHAATYGFLTVAFLLPLLVPLALFDIEPVRGRRRWMLLLLALGAITSAALLFQVVDGPVGATVDGMHIAYSADINHPEALTALYVLATCGTLLVASSRWLGLFGLLNLGVVIALTWLTFTGLTSLWCAWAAITSVVIALYLRRALPIKPVAAVQPA